MEMATAEPPWKMLHFENQFALLMHIARCNTVPPLPPPRPPHVTVSQLKVILTYDMLYYSRLLSRRTPALCLPS
jgi:hypothetical protein